RLGAGAGRLRGDPRAAALFRHSGGASGPRHGVHRHRADVDGLFRLRGDKPAMNEIVLGSVLFIAIVLILSSIVVAARAFLLPTSEISVEVNGTRKLKGKAGSKLLDILADGGVPVPNACGGK